MNQSSMWKWIIAIIVIVLVIWGLSSWGGTKNPLDQAVTLDETAELVVSQPQADDLVTSPLEFKGEALGSWYSEGSFTVELVDEAGQLLGTGQALAEATDTSETVATDTMLAFSGSLDFTPNQATNGYLLFTKSNPDGLPDNALTVKLPVRLSEAETEATTTDDNLETTEPTTSPDTTVVPPVDTSVTNPTPTTLTPAPVVVATPTSKSLALKVFFTTTAGLNSNCAAVQSVTRVVAPTVRVGTAALTELLKGPAAAEQGEGLLTSLPAGVKLNSLTINGGVARADFSPELKVGGSCRVTNIRAQIEQTLKQFPTVQSVIISVAGDSATALQP